MPIGAAGEYASMSQKANDRKNFLAGLDEANSAPDAVYSRKIKAEFDPNGILPIV